MNPDLIQQWIDHTPTAASEGRDPRFPIEPSGYERKRRRESDDEEDGKRRARQVEDRKCQKSRLGYPTPEAECGHPDPKHPRERGRDPCADKSMQDTDQTPRPTRSTEPSFDFDAQSRSSAASSDRSSTKRSRKSGASSPSKRAVLRSLRSNIDFHVLRDASALPAVQMLNVETLIDRVRGLEATEAVVPESEKDALRPHHKVERKFSHPQVYYAVDSTRAGLGGAPSLSDVEYMVAKASQCSELGESEAAWNCHVHAPLLMQAERLSHHQERVTALNITTAKIAPSDLLPSGPRDTPIESKMVDFAIVLQPSQKLARGLRHLDTNTRGTARSYNHTMYNPVIDRPIAVSIETKREADNFEAALFQLGIWTSAHFARLRELLAAAGHGGSPLPCLPTLLVQGQYWHFCLASTAADDGTVIWHSILVGDSSTRLGVYTIVSLLLLLMEWAETEFRPWFERNAVPSV